jgi:hypothetical protein
MNIDFAYISQSDSEKKKKERYVTPITLYPKPPVCAVKEKINKRKRIKGEHKPINRLLM